MQCFTQAVMCDVIISYQRDWLQQFRLMNNLVLAQKYVKDAKTFLKRFSNCLFYFCSTCVDAWSRNKINGH